MKNTLYQENDVILCFRAFFSIVRETHFLMQHYFALKGFRGSYEAIYYRILEDLYNTARTTVPSASAAILHN